jgi:hypothetical protein
MARTHHFFDWLDRFEDSTDVPATGPLPLGEIAVQELASGQTLRGVDGFRLLCKQIPAYRLFLPLLHFPKFRRYVEREVGGCGESACEVSKNVGGRDA